MCLADITVAILCGGLGTRLGLTDRPKCLAEVAGTPLLDRLLAWFREHGAKQFVLCTGHLGEQMAACANSDIALSRDPQPEGVAAALIRAYPILTSPFVLVANGDTLLDVELCRFVRAARVRRTSSILTTMQHGGTVEDSGIRLMPRNEFVALALEQPKNFESWLNLRAGKIFLSGRFLDIGTPERLAQAGDFLR